MTRRFPVVATLPLLVLLLLAALAASGSEASTVGQITFQDPSPWESQQSLLAAPKVEVCDTEVNSFQMTNLWTDPAEPQKGQRLRVVLEGKLGKEMAPGTTLDVRVRFRRIPLLTKRLDLCEELSKAPDAPEHCPITAGDKKWEYGVDLPDNMPSGVYTVDARITDQDGSPVFCVHIELSL